MVRHSKDLNWFRLDPKDFPQRIGAQGVEVFDIQCL